MITGEFAPPSSSITNYVLVYQGTIGSSSSGAALDPVDADIAVAAKAFTLPSGSDAIALKMGQNAGGANEIQLVVGTGPPPAPATDAAASWPVAGVVTPMYSTLIEGVSYVAHLVRWEGRRLRFSVNSNAPWQSWCALQTSYPLGKLDYASNFLQMMFGRPTDEYQVDPVLARAFDVILILHADHEQNASTSTVRMAASSGANSRPRNSSSPGPACRRSRSPSP